MMNSEEVDRLVYSYLVESGYIHTSFSLIHESSLTTTSTGNNTNSNTTNGKKSTSRDNLFNQTVPPGHLVRILQKGLLYLEAEARYRGDPLEPSPRLIGYTIPNALPLPPLPKNRPTPSTSSIPPTPGTSTPLKGVVPSADSILPLPTNISNSTSITSKDKGKGKEREKEVPTPASTTPSGGSSKRKGRPGSDRDDMGGNEGKRAKTTNSAAGSGEEREKKEKKSNAGGLVKSLVNGIDEKGREREKDKDKEREKSKKKESSSNSALLPPPPPPPTSTSSTSSTIPKSTSVAPEIEDVIMSSLPPLPSVIPAIVASLPLPTPTSDSLNSLLPKPVPEEREEGEVSSQEVSSIPTPNSALTSSLPSSNSIPTSTSTTSSSTTIPAPLTPVLENALVATSNSSPLSSPSTPSIAKLTESSNSSKSKSSKHDSISSSSNIPSSTPATSRLNGDSPASTLSSVSSSSTNSEAGASASLLKSIALAKSKSISASPPLIISKTTKPLFSSSTELIKVKSEEGLSNALSNSSSNSGGGKKSSDKKKEKEKKAKKERKEEEEIEEGELEADKVQEEDYDMTGVHELKSDDKIVVRLRGHTMPKVQPCSWNPKVPALLATGGGDSTCRIWDVPSFPFVSSSSSSTEGKVWKDNVVCKHSSAQRRADVAAVAWDPSGSLLATGSEDGIARIWTVSGDLHLVLSMHQRTIFSLKWNSLGTMLLTASLDNSVCLWDVSSGKVKQQWSTHSDSVLDVDWNDDSTFASASMDKSIHLFSTSRVSPVHRFKGHRDEVNVVKFSPCGTLLASCSDDATIRIWSLKNIPGLTLEPGTKIPDGRFIDDEENKGVLVLSGHKHDVHTLAWGNWKKGDGGIRLIASASFDTDAKLWDVNNGDCLHTFTRHTDFVYSITFSPGLGDYLATGSNDGKMCIWSIKEKKLLMEYESEGPVYELAWHPTASVIAVCGRTEDVAVVSVKELENMN